MSVRREPTTYLNEFFNFKLDSFAVAHKSVQCRITDASRVETQLARVPSGYSANGWGRGEGDVRGGRQCFFFFFKVTGHGVSERFDGCCREVLLKGEDQYY